MTVAEFTEALDALLESTRLLAAYDHPSMRPFSHEQARIFGALCETRDAKYRAILAVLEREHEEAERYQHVKTDHKNFALMQNIGHDWTRLEPEEIDAAIDAARKGVSDG